MLSWLRYVLEETEIPASNMLPTHINRSLALMKDGIDYAKNLGGYIDLTTSSDPDYLEEDEVKASAGLRMALHGGVPESHITFSSDGQGSLPVFDSNRQLIGLSVGKVSSLYREFRDAVLTEGLPIQKALLPVTLNPAFLLKLGKKGRIALGSDSDLVLVRKDSLEIDSVFALGQCMVQGGQALVRGTFEG